MPKSCSKCGTHYIGNDCPGCLRAQVEELKENAKKAWKECHATSSELSKANQDRDRWRECAVYLDYRGADYCVAIHKELDGLQEDNRKHREQVSKLLAEWKRRAEAAEARVRELEALDNVPAEYGQCANCGASVRLSSCREWTDESEPCCCQECLDEHERLGCPLEGDGYRKNPRVADLEAFKARVMELARGRCCTCSGMTEDKYGQRNLYTEKCYGCSEYTGGEDGEPNLWEPAWEVKS